MARILVADPDAGARRYLHDVLELAGHEVHEVQDWPTLVGALEQGGADLAVVEPRLPGAPPEGFRALRDPEDPRLPELLLFSDADPAALAATTVAWDADGCLSKGMPALELIETVARAVDEVEEETACLTLSSRRIEEAREKVLVVDTDPRAGGEVRAALGPRARVEEARTFEDLWSHLFEGEFDLVVLDPGAFDLSSRELLRLIRGSIPRGTLVVRADRPPRGLEEDPGTRFVARSAGPEGLRSLLCAGRRRRPERRPPPSEAGLGLEGMDPFWL